MEETLHTAENGVLQERFHHLEQDWESLKQSNPPRRFHSRKYHTEMKPKSVRILKLVNSSSPKQPPSSYPSLEGEWNVRTNDLAMLEMYEERKAKRESGVFKGRKLLDDFENVDLYNDGDDDNGDVVDEECVSDCLSWGSSISMKKMENEKGCGEEEKVAEAVNGGSIRKSDDGGRWMGLMFLFAFLLVIFALGIISSFCCCCCLDGFLDEDMEFIVPT